MVETTIRIPVEKVAAIPFEAAFAKTAQAFSDLLGANSHIGIQQVGHIREGSITIEDKLNGFDVRWNPATQILDWSNIVVTMEDRGRGVGTAITEITEELAQSLRAHRLVISNIINPRWETRLRKYLGYQTHQEIEYAVFKDFEYPED